MIMSYSFCLINLNKLQHYCLISDRKVFVLKKLSSNWSILVGDVIQSSWVDLEVWEKYICVKITLKEVKITKNRVC